MLILILEFEASNLRARKSAHPAKLAYADSNPDFPRRRTILPHLRLEALETEPLAFSSAASAHHTTTPESIAFVPGSGSDESFMLTFASVDDQIAGMARFCRSPEEKTRHKARVWGVYVKPSHRGKGIRPWPLMEELLRRARSQPGLEQVTLSVRPRTNCRQSALRGLGLSTLRPRARSDQSRQRPYVNRRSHDLESVGRTLLSGAVDLRTRLHHRHLLPHQNLHVFDLIHDQVQLPRNNIESPFQPADLPYSPLAPHPVFRSCRFWLIMMTGACIAASIDRNRFSRINGSYPTPVPTAKCWSSNTSAAPRPRK